MADTDDGDLITDSYGFWCETSAIGQCSKLARPCFRTMHLRSGWTLVDEDGSRCAAELVMMEKRWPEPGTAHGATSEFVVT